MRLGLYDRITRDEEWECKKKKLCYTKCGCKLSHLGNAVLYYLYIFFESSVGVD